MKEGTEIFRCPSCKKKFFSKAVDEQSKAYLVVPKDQEGVPVLSCSFECSCRLAGMNDEEIRQHKAVLSKDSGL